MARWTFKVRLRLRSLFGRKSVEQELSDEVRFHLEKLAEESRAKGMTPAEARHAAMRQFGGVEQVKEECRDTRGVHFIEATLQDIRYGLRQLRRSPGFAAVAVVTLALGIGANTAIFSVVENLLLRPLPYNHPDQLIEIWNTYLPAVPLAALSVGDFHDWQKQATTVSAMAGYSWYDSGANLTGGESPERVKIGYASANLFPLLGAKPVVGRLFLPEEDRRGNAPIVILAHHFWQTRFGADPNVLGRVVTLNGLHYSVVGVLPGNSGVLDSPDFWMPLGQFAADPTNHISHELVAIARLKPGVTIDQARAEFQLLNRQSATAYPAEHKGVGVLVRPMQRPAAAQMRQSLLVLFAAVGLVLLIACANIVNLLLARNAAREKEIALRIAIGASSRRLAHQLLTESMLLAFTGGALGLALAAAGVRILSALAPADLSFLQTSHLDGTVFLFTLGVCVLVGIVCGLLPALQVRKMKVNDALKLRSQGSSALSGRKLHSFVVISEVALALFPLVGAGLLLRSLHDLLNVSPGFRAGHLLAMHVPIATIPADAYAKMTPAQRQAAAQQHSVEFLQTVQRVEALPGVRSAAGITDLPLGSKVEYRFATRFLIEGQPIPDGGLRPLAQLRGITPEYFSTMGIPLLRGRALTQEDLTTFNIDINEAMARRFWPQGDAIGKRINLCAFGTKTCWHSIVGIVGNVHEFGLDAAPTYDVYLSAGWTDYLLVRTSGDPHLTASAATDVIHKIDPMLPVDTVSTMDEILDSTVSPRRFSAILISIFAALALLLAAIGVYGVMSYMIGRRTGEMGIRMALGAQPRDVVRMILGEGILLAIIGIVVGTAGAIALTRFLTSMLFEIKPTDPATFVGVAMLLLIVSLAACYIPARRAMRVDPVTALRQE